MAIAFDAYSASSVSTSAASFSWTHIPSAAPQGVYVVTVTSNSSTEHATAVTYGGVALTAETGGSAVDTTGEPAVSTLWSLNSGVPSGSQTIEVSRTNDAVEMVAYAVTVTSGGACAVTGIVLRQNDGSMTTEVAVDDGSPGTNSVRFCAGFTGNATTNAISAGTNSTLLTTTSLGAGARQAAIAQETTAGQGSRSVGWTVGVSDDRAVVYWAVKETAAASGLSITSVTPSSFDDGRTGIVIAGSGFGASQGSSTLTIGGQAQTVTAWSDTSITFTSVRGSNSMGARSLTLTRA